MSSLARFYFSVGIYGPPSKKEEIAAWALEFQAWRNNVFLGVPTQSPFPRDSASDKLFVYTEDDGACLCISSAVGGVAESTFNGVLELIKQFVGTFKPTNPIGFTFSTKQTYTWEEGKPNLVVYGGGACTATTHGLRIVSTIDTLIDMQERLAGSNGDGAVVPNERDTDRAPNGEPWGDEPWG